MINKIFPRLLNSSNDSRVRKKTEMKDAVNITVGDDYDGGYPAGDAADGSEGDVGVIKPARGTTEVDIAAAYELDSVFEPDSNDPERDYQRRVLGTVVDDRTDTVYIFVYSNVITEIGVYAYDGSGYFGSQGNWRPIYTTSEFQWTEFTRVVGDVVHVSGGVDVDFRPILYFTDNENEPRRLDVLYFVENGYRPPGDTGGLLGYTSNSAQDKDVICACPRSPVHPPTFEFFTEPNRSASDFRRVPGVQFAYQCIYVSGEVSAISTYSDIAVPEEYLRQGTVIGSLDIPHLCRIRIQQLVDGALAFSDAVVRFKILVRRGNTGAFYEVDEVDRSPTNNLTFYDFYNDRVLSALTESEENKQYDNLPRIAEAISVAENRLFFGNYVEGYDEVPLEGLVQPRYVAGAIAGDAIELQSYPLITNVDSSITSVGEFPVPSDIHERLPGVIIDTSAIPTTIPANTTITASITFEPSGGYQVYTAVGGNHNSRMVGVSGQYNTEPPLPQMFDTTNVPIDNSYNLQDNQPLLGRGVGTDGVGQNLEWHTTETVIDSQTVDRDVCVGTSAVGALRIDGRPSSFACEIVTTGIVNNAPYAVAQAIGAVMGDEVEALPANFQILASNVSPSYTYDLGFVDPDPSNGNTRIMIKSNDPTNSITIGDQGARQLLDLITPVHPQDYQDGDSPAACGYIIVNSATVQMRLVHQPLMASAGNISQGCVLTLEVGSITNTDIRTCIPIVELPNLMLHSWRVYTGQFLADNDITSLSDLTELQLADRRYAFNLNQIAKLYSAAFWDLSADQGTMPEIVDSAPFRRNLIGYLRSQGSSGTQPANTDLYVSNATRRQAVTPSSNLPTILQRAIINATGTSMCDTEGAMTTQQAQSTDGITSSFSEFVEYVKTYQYEGYDYEGVVSSLMVMTGELIRYASPNPKVRIDLSTDLNGNSPPADAVANEYFTSIWSSTDMYEANDQFPTQGPPTKTYYRMLLYTGNGDDYIDNASPIHALGATFKSPALYNGTNLATVNSTYLGQAGFTDTDGQTESSEVEIVYNVVVQEQGLTAGYRSFKTSAFHDLGVVYYDDRGRPGNVNLLPRAYVAGYSNEQRGIAKGRVELEISLLSDPPEWAHQYQIVYAGNSTYSDFVQYSVGGAFIDERGEGGVASDRPIYLSLNYLQQDKQVSYAQAFGAYHPDGSKELYTFAPGDQVRVLYYDGDSGPVYPNNAVFDIIDQVLTTGNTEDLPEQALNPLDSGAANTPLFLQGSFIVIRNNAETPGFNWQSVSAQGNEYASANPQSNWNKNCIVEILRPRAVTDPDSRAYKETGLVFNVGRGNNTGGAQGAPTGLYHQVNTIFMQNGDVWWRRVPVNLAQRDEDTNFFPSLIPASQEDDPDLEIDPTYQPRFRNVYLECRAFTDTFPSANVNGYGKEKFYFPDSAEVRRDSSITYSDRNEYSRLRVQYSSFNPYQLPFVDLPNQYGGINALVAFNEYILVIQENKTSIVPINRSILSDASGGDQLISSDKVIGKQKFLPGQYGADNNRESVIKVEDYVYFAHKTRGEVYRYGGGKVEVVSRKGVSGFLYDAFQDNLNIANVMRVVSGYDALKDEYIISILNINAFNEYFTITPFTQPALDPFTYDPFGSVTADGTTFEDLGGSGGGVIPDIAGDEDWDNGYEDPMDGDVDDIVDTGGTAPDGVAPGPWQPNDPDKPIVDLEYGNAEYLKRFSEGLDPEPNGGGIIFNAVAIQTFVLSNLSIEGAFEPKSVVIDSVIPPTVAAILRRSGVAINNLIELQKPSGPYGIQWNLNTNAIEPSESVSFDNNAAYYAQVADPPLFEGTDYNNLLGSPEVYKNLYLNYGFSFTRSIRGQILAYSYLFTDTANQLVANLKDSSEKSIKTRTTADIPALLVEIEADLGAADLLSNATLSNLLEQAQIAQVELQNFVLETLGGNDTTTITFIDEDRPDIEADGLSLFSGEDYPLNDFAIFQLNNIKTLTANIGDYVRPLLTLEDVDVSSIVSALGSRIASLRSQLDIVTNQVQNLSSAPTEFGAEEFVPGVVINQLQDRALAELANADGDGVLTRADIVLKPEIQSQITTIIDLFASSGGVEIDAELVRNVVVNYFLRQTENDPTSNLLFDDLYVNPSYYSLYNFYDRRTKYPKDIDSDGIVGVEDVLQALSGFGTQLPDIPQGSPNEVANLVVQDILDLYNNAE